MAFYVYILKCSDNSYYTGHTDNLEMRFGEHQSGLCGGYTAKRLPIELVYSENFPTRLEALEAEQKIKGWSRAKKEALIENDWTKIKKIVRDEKTSTPPSNVSGSAQPERNLRVLNVGSVLHKGHCHCGVVTFEVEAPADLHARHCNCSVCKATGFLHLIVESGKFHLLTGADNLTEYTFGTRTAKHLFCKACGIKSFYIPRSHPDGVSVNANCLDKDTITSLTITEFDGANWEDNIHKIT